MQTVRLVAVLAAGVAIAGVATGITYAATSISGGTVHACRDAKGVLALLNSHGHCPSHFVKVTLNQQGPRGKTGKTGKTGPAGPGAIRLAVASTGGLVTKESAPIAGSTLTVEVLCSATDEAQVYINLNAPGKPFTFEGTGSWDGSSGSGMASWLDPTTDAVVPQALGATVKQVAAQQNGEAHSVEFTATGGTLVADVLVTQGGHSFSVQMGEYRDPTRCFAHAMVTPAS